MSVCVPVCACVPVVRVCGDFRHYRRVVLAAVNADLHKELEFCAGVTREHVKGYQSWSKPTTRSTIPFNYHQHYLRHQQASSSPSAAAAAAVTHHT
jgi:hypothetical protein